MFTSNNIKGLFFLATLLDTLNNIIDNLSTKGVTAFKDIELKILNIYDKYTLDSTNISSSIYATR